MRAKEEERHMGLLTPPQKKEVNIELLWNILVFYPNISGQTFYPNISGHNGP
jgi:hypothetical protein